jgi:quercetin dioxygenase-like cupin family protein
MATTAPLMMGEGLRALSLSKVKAAMGAPPWSTEVITTNGNRAVVICQPPGHPNDTHYHNADEWWFIAEGAQTWEFEDGVKVEVQAGDFVFAPKGIWHHISVIGDTPAIRIAVSLIGEFHRYDRPGCAPVEKKA